MVKEKMKHGEMSERLRHVHEQMAYGAHVTEKARVQELIRELEEQLEELVRQRERLDSDIRDVRSRLQNAESELERVEESQDHLDELLSDIEAGVVAGQRVDPTHPRVKTAAEIANETPKDIIRRLQERNPDVPDEAFRYAQPHEDPMWNADK